MLPPGYDAEPIACDLMSISPKRANSTPPPDTPGGWAARHEARRDAPDVIRELIDRYHYQMKFVIDSPADLDDVADYLTAYPEIDPGRVFTMPQATDAETLATKTAWLAPLAAERGWKVSPRIHVARWGNRRGV